MIELIATVVTAIFLLFVLSYYVLLFIPAHKRHPQFFKSITIIIPARNEAPYIEACIRSVQQAAWDGTKQIIVVNDGSLDATGELIRTIPGITIITNKTHLGKSASMNIALKDATGDVVAIVDGDSEIAVDALKELAREVSRKDVAGAAAVVKVKNRNKFLNIWVHIELLYASLLRSIFSKVHANVTTPGALSMYRRDVLQSVGGFNTQGFSEDLDIAIRMIRNGYKIGFSDRAVSYTNMPDDTKGFLRQRTRLARGMIHVLKKQFQLNGTIIDLYTLPLFLFTYLQAIIMGGIILWQIGSGYWTYFAAYGEYMNLSVLKFFFEWFSIVGTIKWMISVFQYSQWTLGNLVGILSSLLTYPLFLFAIIKYDRRFGLTHAFPLFFMFPFWFLLMMIYLVSTPEIFFSKQYNRWKKNE